MSVSEQTIPDEVIVEVHHVRDQVWDLFGQWNLYRGLFGTQDSVNAANHTFTGEAAGLIQQAIRTEVASAVGRLLDPAFDTVGGKERANLSLRRLVSHVEKYRPEKCGGLKSRLDQLRKMSKPLLTWRNKHHAHRDRDTTMNLSSEKLPSMQLREFEALFSTLEDLTSRVVKVLDESTTDYSVAYENGVSYLVGFVRDQHRASQERYQRILKNL
jgi:hypothetical protein